MLIKRITIDNFQSYYGSQTLEFSQGLNLVIGNGGKGKSKLFNAFYWVLFGKIYIGRRPRDSCFYEIKTRICALRENIK